MPRVTVDGTGEVMALLIDRGRPYVVVGPPGGEPDKIELLWAGERFHRLKHAREQGMKHYFRLYLERYGFHHPEDPNGKPGRELPLSVAVLKSEDDGPARIYSQTYDPDQLN